MKTKRTSRSKRKHRTPTLSAIMREAKIGRRLWDQFRGVTFNLRSMLEELAESEQEKSGKREINLNNIWDAISALEDQEHNEDQLEDKWNDASDFLRGAKRGHK
jgi:hypothetical protein